MLIQFTSITQSMLQSSAIMKKILFSLMLIQFTSITQSMLQSSSIMKQIQFSLMLIQFSSRTVNVAKFINYETNSNQFHLIKFSPKSVLMLHSL